MQVRKPSSKSSKSKPTQLVPREHSVICADDDRTMDDFSVRGSGRAGGGGRRKRTAGRGAKGAKGASIRDGGGGGCAGSGLRRRSAYTRALYKKKKSRSRWRRARAARCREVLTVSATARAAGRRMRTGVLGPGGWRRCAGRMAHPTLPPLFFCRVLTGGLFWRRSRGVGARCQDFLRKEQQALGGEAEFFANGASGDQVALGVAASPSPARRPSLTACRRANPSFFV